MNMNGQSADNSMDESHKMTSQMLQILSQQPQVVETTPGHSQKTFAASETVNLKEKNCEAHTKSTTGNTMMPVTSLGSLLGMPVKLPSMGNRA